MGKRLKRLRAILLFLLAIFCLSAAGIYALFRGTPQWYTLPARTESELAGFALVAEQKLTQTQQFFEAAHAQEVQNRYARRNGAATVSISPTSQNSPQSLTVSFTQDELNAIFAKWSVVRGWNSKYDQYISDPVVILHDGRVIFAAKVKEMGTVVSLHFEPKLDDDGRLRLDLVKILGGNLRLPEAAIDKPRQRLTDSMRASLPAWQQAARIDSTGATNGDAVSAALAKLALSALRHEAGEPVIFLPLLSTSKDHAVPVRLTALKIENDAITITVEPLSASDRAALLERIREPDTAVAALSAARPREPAPTVN